MLTLTLTFTVGGTTAEDLHEHVECMEHDICSLLEENLEQIASLESYEVTTNQTGE